MPGRVGTESLVTIGAAVVEIYRKVWRGAKKAPPPTRARVKKNGSTCVCNGVSQCALNVFLMLSTYSSRRLLGPSV